MPKEIFGKRDVWQGRYLFDEGDICQARYLASEIFAKGDIWRRRHFQEVLTCPLGFWRGVKLSPQKTRREERRVRKTKQGKRPWVESRKGLTKLDFEQS